MTTDETKDTAGVPEDQWWPTRAEAERRVHEERAEAWRMLDAARGRLSYIDRAVAARFPAFLGRARELSDPDFQNLPADLNALLDAMEAAGRDRSREQAEASRSLLDAHVEATRRARADAERWRAEAEAARPGRKRYELLKVTTKTLDELQELANQGWRPVHLDAHPVFPRHFLPPGDLWTGLLCREVLDEEKP